MIILNFIIIIVHYDYEYDHDDNLNLVYDYHYDNRVNAWWWLQPVWVFWYFIKHLRFKLSLTSDLFLWKKLKLRTTSTTTSSFSFRLFTSVYYLNWSRASAATGMSIGKSLVTTYNYIRPGLALVTAFAVL